MSLCPFVLQTYSQIFGNLERPPSPPKKLDGVGPIDNRQLTPDMLHTESGEHSLKISAPSSSYGLGVMMF